MTQPKPITAADCIPPGSAQVRPSPQQEFEARLRNSTVLSPKAQADQQRQAQDQKLIEKGRKAAAQTKDAAMAARMYPKQAPKPAAKAAAKPGAKLSVQQILARDEAHKYAGR